MSTKTNILLIYTGGTIGMVKEYASGVLKAFDFKNLMDAIPELNQLDCHIDCVSFEQPIDSSNMDVEHWANIAQLIDDHYHTHDGFVVLHGSDTMGYTASALSFMLENLRKPVILTGSQLPIGDLRTDAKENLITSIQIAALREKDHPLIQEVALYFEYKLYRGNRTTKINAEQFEAFASLNYPPLVTSGVHLTISHEYLYRPLKGKKMEIHDRMDTRVAVLKIFPGLTREVLKGVLGISGLKGLVLETYGAGNAPTKQWWIDELKQAVAGGLHVVNVTQCSGGGVMVGRYETSKHLMDLQIIDGRDITTEAAVTKLMYLLGTGVSAKLFRTVFETSLRGEMT